MPEPIRCTWQGADPLYVAYHDTEWGVPEHDARALWEKLVLDGFQAGLSWITILRKREAFREAFEGFDPERVARYGSNDVERLLGDPGIVRSRAKIEAAIDSAQAFLAVEGKGEGFTRFVWSRVEGAPVQNAFTRESGLPPQTPVSVQLSKDLKAQGFKFCGPVIVYAWMEACGLVNDHLVDCFRHAECGAMAEG